MVRVLPYLYGAFLGLQVAVLSVLYAVAPPAPSDPLSIWLGWIGLGSMIVMLIYSIARRSRRARQIARLSAWLHLHIFLGLEGFVCVFFHSFHLFTREAAIVWLNPGVLNFLAVCIVVASGVFGRYLYAQLPRAIGGEQLAAKQVDEEIAAMDTPMPEEVQALWKEQTIRGVFGIIRADLETRAAVRKIKRMSLDAKVKELAARRVWLERRKAMLRSTLGIFRAWIFWHRPVAAVMYVLSFVHVALAYMFTPALGG